MLRKLQVLVLGFGFAVGAAATVGCEGAKDKTTGPTVNNDSKRQEMQKSANDRMKDLGEKAKDGAKDVADKGKDVAGKVGDKIAEGADKAKDVAGDLVAKAKETFLKPIQEMLGTADTKIAKLADEEKAATTPEAKKVVSDKMAKAKELMGKVKEKIAAISTASGDKWEALKDELSKLLPELKTTLGL